LWFIANWGSSQKMSILSKPHDAAAMECMLVALPYAVPERTLAQSTIVGDNPLQCFVEIDATDQ